jgi:hypothetical protein
MARMPGSASEIQSRTLLRNEDVEVVEKSMRKLATRQMRRFSRSRSRGVPLERSTNKITSPRFNQYSLGAHQPKKGIVAKRSPAAVTRQGVDIVSKQQSSWSDSNGMQNYTITISSLQPSHTD